MQAQTTQMRETETAWLTEMAGGRPGVRGGRLPRRRVRRAGEEA